MSVQRLPGLTRMKEARLKLGLSQEEMAQRLNITQATYSRTETGATKPDEMLLGKIAEILGVPSDRLLENAIPGVYVEKKMAKAQGEQLQSTLDPKDIPAIIRELKSLHDDGIIDDAEFETKKKDLLARL